MVMHTSTGQARAATPVSTAILSPGCAAPRDEASHDGGGAYAGATPAREPLLNGIGDYLRHIGTYPLLTASEEVSLAKSIEVGVLAQHRIDSVPGQTPANVRELMALVHEGRVAHRQFIHANLRLVVSVARRYSRSGFALMDLIQDGNLGLDQAVKRFDYARGFKFSTYAIWWIRHSITRGMADTGQLIRVPTRAMEKINRLRRLSAELASRFGREPTPAELAMCAEVPTTEVHRLLRANRAPLSLDAPVAGQEPSLELAQLIADNSASVTDMVAAAEIRAIVRARLNDLPERDARVLRLRFGLNGTAPKSLSQVGDVLGVTRERVRQLEKRAFARLRAPELHDYL